MLETLYNLNNDKRSQHRKALKRAIGDMNTKIMTDPKLGLVLTSAIVQEP